MTIGSLFSGIIGGLELGLEMAGLGPTLWQVEREPFPRCVLQHHWPESRLFDDVCTVGKANLAPVDLVCGGFPCQDVSSAGKGAGLAGERSGLWREFARVVAELRPSWVVVENVQSGARRWFDAVVRELEQLGYAVLPVPLAARDVGAPHRRERLFIVANADGCGELQPEGLFAQQRRRAEDGAAADVALNGRGQGRHDVRARESDPARDTSDAADAHHSRRKGSGPSAHGRRIGSSADPWWPPEPGLVPLVHGLPGGLAGRKRRARIRALGNAVVPQCAEVVGWVIRELAGLTEVA